MDNLDFNDWRERTIVDMSKVRHFTVRQASDGRGLIDFSFGNEPGHIVWYDNYDLAREDFDKLKAHVVSGNKYVEYDAFLNFYEQKPEVIL